LRDAGHDVIWAREAAPGATDELIVRLAHEDARILLTADKDFGAIGLRVAHPLPGIILLRFPPGAWHAATESALRLLKLAPNDLRGRIVVLTPGRARFRKLPDRS
jgi:predicted nuclease of predicted toxin-antitoxin system